MAESQHEPPKSRFWLVRIIDRCVVMILEAFIAVAHIKSRDPLKGWSRLFKFD